MCELRTKDTLEVFIRHDEDRTTQPGNEFKMTERIQFWLQTFIILENTYIYAIIVRNSSDIWDLNIVLRFHMNKLSKEYDHCDNVRKNCALKTDIRATLPAMEYGKLTSQNIDWF